MYIEIVQLKLLAAAPLEATSWSTIGVEWGLGG